MIVPLKVLLSMKPLISYRVCVCFSCLYVTPTGGLRIEAYWVKMCILIAFYIKLYCNGKSCNVVNVPTCIKYGLVLGCSLLGYGTV